MVGTLRFAHPTVAWSEDQVERIIRRYVARAAATKEARRVGYARGAVTRHGTRGNADGGLRAVGANPRYGCR